MRCPDCNKFVGIEMADPELELELGDGEVTGTVRLIQTCAECSTELAVAEPSVEIPFEFEHGVDGCDGELELSDEEAENDDRFDGKGRGAKHFYIANISVTVACPKCNVEVKVEGSVEEQASFFDSMV